MLNLLSGSSCEGVLGFKNLQNELSGSWIGNSVYIDSDPSTMSTGSKERSASLAVRFSNDLKNTLNGFGNIKSFL